MSNRDAAYEIVTDRILVELDQGRAPWRQPWRPADRPRNLDGRPYRGVNVFMLLASGYRLPFWLTFNQSRERGGSVRKGERATPVVFWKLLEAAREDEETGERRLRKVPFLRYYNVFNLEQIDGINPPADWEAPAPLEPIAAAEAVVAAYPAPAPSIRAGDKAAYAPMLDQVIMPARDQFLTADGYYATLFHELGHSTGHKDRLGRDGIVKHDGFGSMNYGREELIAEMAAAFLCGETGILPAVLENSAAYLRHWAAEIREDRRAVVVAAGAAQRAADYILGRLPKSEEAPMVAAAA